MIRAVIFDMYETLITHYRCPRYFGADMVADAGVPAEPFLRVWHETEELRGIGNMTLEKALKRALMAGGKRGVACDTMVSQIVEKRMAIKRMCFDHLHEEILPMLQGLRVRGIRVGLISNCFSEEAQAIRESVLFPYFDGVCLSWEEGVQKPDAAIFERCAARLGCRADECLYVGDGGSHELEAAQAFGMDARQAVWYLQPGSGQPVGRLIDFPALEMPIDVLTLVDEANKK